MSIAREQVPPRRKRQHAEVDVSLHDPFEFESRPSKRLKPSIKLHSAEFYDSLSRVWLTRRALKELDRRTSQVNACQRPASVHQQRDRGDTWTKQIKKFARHGGPELCDLRGYPAPTDNSLVQAMSSRRGSRSSGSRRTQSTAPTSNPASKSSNRRSSAYDNDFEQHLIDHRVYPKGYDYPDNREAPEPGNLEGFYQRLAQPRPSLSPSRFTTSDFRTFERKNDRVISEGKVMSTVLPIISGDVDIPNESDLFFTRLEPIADGTIVDARPDFYDGARLAEIDKQVQQDLGPFIIPTGHAMAPVAPNFFLEAKAPNGGADVVKRQACYNGAIGARAMHKLQSYKQEPVYDNNAYTFTSTYHAGTGTLQMYTTHLSQADDGAPEYHMTQVNTWGLTGNPISFREGAAAFRNARDWAQEQRDTFISVANERATPANVELPTEYNNSLDPTEVHGAIYAQDTTHAGDSTDVQDATYAPVEDLAGDSHSYTSQQQFQGEVTTSGPSTFQPSDYGDLDGSQPSTLVPSDYIIECELSAGELALDTYATTTVPTKRRSGRISARPVVKVPRHSKDSHRKQHKK